MAQTHPQNDVAQKICCGADSGAMLSWPVSVPKGVPMPLDAKPPARTLALLTTYAKLHLFIAAALLGLLSVIDPLWRGLRSRAYLALDDPLKLQGALQTSTNDHVASLLSLILPHALNNTPGFTLSLAKVMRSGALANLGIAVVAIGSKFVLQLAPRWLPTNRRTLLTRVCLSLVLACDVSTLIVGASGLLFHMPANLKVPLWPLSIWPDIIGVLLATYRVYPVTHERWKNARLDHLVDPTISLTSLQHLSDFQGLRTLHAIFSSDKESFLTFLVQCFEFASRDFIHGVVPLLLCFFGLLVTDVIPVVIKLRAILQAGTEIRSLRPLKRIVLGPFVYFFATLAVAALFLVQYPTCTMTDTFDHLEAPTVSSAPNYLLFTKSFPGSTADVRISADVFVPPQILRDFASHLLHHNASRLLLHGHEDFSGAQGDSHLFQRSPTFFSATRYNRRMTLRWPFTGLRVWSQKVGDNSAAIFTWPLTKGLLSEGLPLVVMDARGTGASNGARMVDLDADEVEDFRIVASWAKQQVWSNSILAGGGVSYDGLTSLKLAAVDESPIDVVVAMFSPLNPVSDLLQNNGMASRAFVDDYSGMTTAFEREGNPLLHWLFAEVVHIPLQIKLGFLFAFRLPLPARGWEDSLDRKTLKVQRASNWDLKRIADSTMFLDDSITLVNGQEFFAVDGGVNDRDLQSIIDRKIPTYWSAGECDSTSVRRAESMFSRLDHKEGFHRLVIGPWGHGGRRGCGTEPHQGSWACAELQGMRDMAQFVRSASTEIVLRRSTHKHAPSERSMRSTRYGYVSSRTGGWWHTREIDADQGISKSEGVILPLGSLLVPVEWWSREDLETVDARASLAIAHLLSVPRSLVVDLKTHVPRLDLAGAAHDVSEILMIIGSRLNRIILSTKILSRAILDAFTHEHTAPVNQSTAPENPSQWTLIDKFISSDFATTGSLSRWSIVQHLMRYPLDSDHSIACSANLRRFLDRVRASIQKWRGSQHRASTVLEFLTPRLETDIVIEGPLRLQLPFLLLPSDLPDADDQYLDWAVVAVLQEEDATEHPDPRRRTYVSEGRAVISMRSGGGADVEPSDKILYNITHDLPKALREGLPFDDAFEEDARLSRAHFLPASLRLKSDKAAEGMLLYVRFQMEAANRRVAAGSRLRLTLLPEDQTNFPWKRTEEKMRSHRGLSIDAERRASSIKRLTQWRIPIMPQAKHAGWLHLPKSIDDVTRNSRTCPRTDVGFV